ncbi:MAG: PaaI family thioesterase [Panacagrimonas sp.]
MNLLNEAASDQRQHYFVGIVPHSHAPGIRYVEHQTGRVTFDLPYREDLVGDPFTGVVHGGALGALLEFAAICPLMLVAEVKTFPKIVNITVEYLRGAQPPLDTDARATVRRHGRRVANVRAIAYQADASKPITAANAHFLLSV